MGTTSKVDAGLGARTGVAGQLSPSRDSQGIDGRSSFPQVEIQRGKSHLRLIGDAELVEMIFKHYEKFEPAIKTLLSLKNSYIPAAIMGAAAG